MTAGGRLGVVAVLTATLLAAPLDNAMARDCTVVEPREERLRCMEENVAELTVRTQAYVCAQRLVEHTFIIVGAEMGASPSEVAASIARDPERAVARMRQVLREASRAFGGLLEIIVLLEDQGEERQHIKRCVETLSPSPFDEGRE